MSEKNENSRFVKLLNGNCSSAVNKLNKSRHENVWKIFGWLDVQKLIKDHEQHTPARAYAVFRLIIICKLHTHTHARSSERKDAKSSDEFTVKILNRVTHLLTYWLIFVAMYIFLCYYFARIYLHTWQLKNIVLY